jgi:hypothetical protein
MGHVEHLTAIADTAISRIPSWQRKPVTEVINRAKADAVQEQEDFFWLALQLIRLATATGDTLEIWGRLVGELRDGFSDAELRRAINARATANRSKYGRAEDLIFITKILTDADRVKISQVGRAHMRIEYDIASRPLAPHLVTALVRMIGLAAQHGVSWTIVEAETGAAFRFDVGPGFDVGKFGSIVGSSEG